MVIDRDDDKVIIAGMPKSGTTAISKLLGAATGMKVFSDPFYQLDQMGIKFREEIYSGELSLDSLWNRHQRVFSGEFVKDPNFPFLLSQIRVLFPNAKIVFILRDPRDNIRSILNRLKLPGKIIGSEDLNVIKNNAAWHNLLTGKSPAVPGSGYIEVLAWRWRKAAEAFLEFKEFGIEIRYEDFNKNKKSEINKLANKLGYTELFDINHLVDVQYQPKGDAKVDLDVFFGKPQLETIDRITGPILKEFGYEKHNANS